MSSQFLHLHKKRRPMGKGILSLLFMLLMVSTFVVGVVWTIARAIFNISLSPDTKAWRSLLERLRSRLRSQTTTLIPWDREMPALLSLNRVAVKKPGWFDSISEGVLTTIYHEPVLSYVYRPSGKNTVVVARTSNREFILNKKAKEIEIWVNNAPFGTLANGALLAAGRDSRLMARLEFDPLESQFPVVFGNKTAATIINPAKTDSPNPRALSLLRDLSPDEENAMLALVCCTVIFPGG